MSNLIRGISENGGVVFCGVDSTEIVRTAEKLHTTSATCSAALGRLLTGVSLMGAMLKDDGDSITLRVSGGGPAGVVIACTDAHGNVKGCIDHPLVELPAKENGHLDVGGAVGKDGVLTVIRDNKLQKEPTVGQVPLVSGEIAEDITSYYAYSEQIPTVCALGVLVDKDLSIACAGGYLLQLLPGATDAEITRLEQNIAAMPSVTEMLRAGKTPQDMMELLEGAGCPVVVQRGRRVFPATEKASDVTRTLARLMQQSGVEVRYGSRVQALMTETAEDGALHVTGVRLMDGTALPAERVILATGGLSCPLTGSTGDGYRLAESLGHTTTPRMGVLSAIETDCDWCGRLQGLALKNVTLTLKKGKKVLYSDLGEMLFTHFGISGPLTLTMSCHLPENLAEANVTLDLKPGLTAQQLDMRLQRELAEDSRRQLRNVLPHLLPASFAEIFPELCGVDGSKVCAQVTKEEREKLVSTLKSLPIPLKKLAPIEEAIVTRGGVNVREIDPATMESRKVSGLYFAGEVIDVDAHTGGYNLQIAWATGALAGQSAGEKEIEAI